MARLLVRDFHAKNLTVQEIADRYGLKSRQAVYNYVSRSEGAA